MIYLHLFIIFGLCRFRRERGDGGHNLVTVVMNQLGVGPQMAFDYISDLYNETEARFLEEWKNIPTYEGPLDLDVRMYCYGLGNWVRANHSWNFEVCLESLSFCNNFKMIIRRLNVTLERKRSKSTQLAR